MVYSIIAFMLAILSWMAFLATDHETALASAMFGLGCAILFMLCDIRRILKG